MVIAYIGLGANLGNCRENILQAWSRLGEVNGVQLLALSSPYRSEPVGMESENWFINAVGSLQTTLEPEELLAEMLSVEASLGRKRVVEGLPADRSVDLDLLYWGDRISNDPGVTLPHPGIAKRLFVLKPLAEIGPEQVHPVTQKTSLEMLQDCVAEKPGAGQGNRVYITSWSETEEEVAE
ncbi:2-amino-4-hydroxy-6-hydroxymethyldihydropteridine diphosphokinase [Thermodesulfobacteriota bacterium]